MVSCVIPVFNGEAFLAEAIDSALAQTYTPLEVIVIDDGSTDGSAEIAIGYAPLGVRCARQSNGGLASARNHGIRIAEGELLAFLDADDIWHADKLAIQAPRFEASNGLAASITYMQNFWMPGLEHEAEASPALRKPQPGAGGSLMARKKTFDEIGMFNPNLADRDVQEWIMRAKLAGWNHEVLTDVLVQRRIHANNLSRSRKPGESELLRIASALQTRRKTGSPGHR